MDARLRARGLVHRHPGRQPSKAPHTKDDGAGIHGIDLNLRKGEIVGLVGRNGSGKTTLLQVLAGILPMHGGFASIEAYDLHDPKTAHQARACIGIMPERVRWSGRKTAQEALARIAMLRDIPKYEIKEKLEVVGLKRQAKAQLNTLSQGMQQRLSLASALLGNPNILLLDEPLNGLDPLAQRSLHALLQGLRDQGTSILISSHRLRELATLVDRIAVIESGLVLTTDTIEGACKHLHLARGAILGGTTNELPKSKLLEIASEIGIIKPEITKLDHVNEEKWRLVVRPSSGEVTTQQRALLAKRMISSGAAISTILAEPIELDRLIDAAMGEEE